MEREISKGEISGRGVKGGRAGCHPVLAGGRIVEMRNALDTGLLVMYGAHGGVLCWREKLREGGDLQI